MSISNYTGEKEDPGLPNDSLLGLTGGSDVRKPRNLASQVPQSHQHHSAGAMGRAQGCPALSHSILRHSRIYTEMQEPRQTGGQDSGELTAYIRPAGAGLFS